MLTVGVGALAAGLLLGAVYGWDDGALTAGLLVVLGGTGLVAAHVAAARRERLGMLRRQFSLAVAIAIGEIVIAIVVFALLMFVDHHDAVVIIVLAVFVGAVSVRVTQLIAGGVMRDIETVRDGLEGVGLGEREARMHTQAHDELAELATAANAMVDRLDAEEGARRDLVAAVSHDLRTPITSLRLLSDALSDDIVDEGTRREYLDRMRTHIDALSALIDDLFELSRLESGDIQWSMEQVSVDELVGETVDALRAQAEANGLRLEAELPDTAGGGHGEPGEGAARAVQPDPERDPPHAAGRDDHGARGAGGRRSGGRGRRHGRGHRPGRPRPGVRRVLPRGRPERAKRSGRRPGPGDLPGDHRGPRRADLARRCGCGDADPVRFAGHAEFGRRGRGPLGRCGLRRPTAAMKE